MIIAIDFDAIVEDEITNTLVPYVIDWIRILERVDCDLVIWTRDPHTSFKQLLGALGDAGVNTHNIRTIHSDKDGVEADFFVDSNNPECPTIILYENSVVDWNVVGQKILSFVREQRNG